MTNDVSGNMHYSVVCQKDFYNRSDVVCNSTACNYSYMQLGLMDFNARFYSPTLGRFTQPDTVIPDLKNSQGWNRYTYVYNSPINYVDPSGHFIEKPRTPPICIDRDCNLQDELIKKSKTRPGVIYRLPVDKEEESQPFGATLYALYHKDDYSYCQEFHCGIDFFDDYEAPVYAGVYGTVVALDAPFEGPYNIVIQGGDFYFKYGHTTGVYPVGIGDEVSPDTIIGYVGNPHGDPNAGNNHIHFEVRSPDWGGLSYNPQELMSPDVNERYTAILLNQEEYLSGKYWDPNSGKSSRLPIADWQVPKKIMRTNNGSSLWPVK